MRLVITFTHHIYTYTTLTKERNYKISLTEILEAGPVASIQQLESAFLKLPLWKDPLLFFCCDCVPQENLQIFGQHIIKMKYQQHKVNYP